VASNRDPLEAFGRARFFTSSPSQDEWMSPLQGTVSIIFEELLFRERSRKEIRQVMAA
jgi:hypothetical protein